MQTIAVITMTKQIYCQKFELPKNMIKFA